MTVLKKLKNAAICRIQSKSVVAFSFYVMSWSEYYLRQGTEICKAPSKGLITKHSSKRIWNQWDGLYETDTHRNCYVEELQFPVFPQGGTIPHIIPASKLAFTVVPPGAKGSLVAAVSFWKQSIKKRKKSLTEIKIIILPLTFYSPYSHKNKKPTRVICLVLQSDQLSITF